MAERGKAIEKYHLRPTYAEANVGHPSSSYWVLLEQRLRRGAVPNSSSHADNLAPVVLLHCRVQSFPQPVNRPCRLGRSRLVLLREFHVIEEFIVVEIGRRSEEANYLHLLRAGIAQHVHFPLGK
jgi:hypothetical protein